MQYYLPFIFLLLTEADRQKPAETLSFPEMKSAPMLRSSAEKSGRAAFAHKNLFPIRAGIAAEGKDFLPSKLKFFVLHILSTGAGDRGRTDTVLPPRDFESRTSANSITPANTKYILPHSSVNDNLKISDLEEIWKFQIISV